MDLAMAIVIGVFLFIMGFVMGAWVNEDEITKSCERLGAFYKAETIYKCERK